MKCFSCNVKMIVSDELCWRIGQNVKTEKGELYSKRHTCPKCGHYERTDFVFANENLIDKIKKKLDEQ